MKVWVVTGDDGRGVFGVFSSEDSAYDAIASRYRDWVKRVDRLAGQVCIEQSPGLFATTLYVISRKLDNYEEGK